MGGGLPPEGVVVEKFVPSLESLPWVSQREESGMSREFCRDVRKSGGVQKVCAKKVRVHFVPQNPEGPAIEKIQSQLIG